MDVAKTRKLALEFLEGFKRDEDEAFRGTEATLLNLMLRNHQSQSLVVDDKVITIVFGVGGAHLVVTDALPLPADVVESKYPDVFIAAAEILKEERDKALAKKHEDLKT